VDETFEKRLRQAETDVVREFEALDGAIVRAQFERVAGDLLRNATVTDFVPVLARRHAREILQEMPAAAAATAGISHL
jgi:hypothetical protein